MIRDPTPAVRSWLARWRPVLPLMAAELILWLGFGSFLPVLPLYVTARGVDVPMLGVVIAAWPAARLLAEPIFGWLADRTRRVPLMVIGLMASAVFAAAPLAVSGLAAFVALRALAGLAAAVYDPAARGYIMDATPSDRRGEAFGLYGAAQMAGFLLGPALGALAAAATGRTESVFVLGGISVGIAGLVVAFGVREQPRRGLHREVPSESITELQREAPIAVGRAATAALRDAARDGRDAVASPGSGPAVVSSLLNRTLIAAIVLNFGAFFAGGTWEVIWSLYMQERGASIEFIGFTFALFSLPVLVFSPLVGRLVDRRGPLAFIVAGSLITVVTGLAYTVAFDLLVIAGIVVIEALGWALVSPAVYAVVGAGSPPGRTSTAQGVFGSSGTLAYILSAVLAGTLFATDIRYPFYLLSIVVFVTLVLALLIAGRTRLRGSVGAPARPEPATSAASAEGPA